jgi:hypothetical protein
MSERAQRTPGVYRELAREGEDLVFRTGVPAFVGYAAGPAAPVALSRWAQFAGKVAAPLADGLLAPAVRGFFSAGGLRCAVVAVPPQAGPAGLVAAVDRLTDDGDTDLVCAPDLLLPFRTGQRADQAALAELVARQVELVRAAARRRSLALLDGPPTLAAALTHAGKLRDALAGAGGPGLVREAALHFPWVRAPGDSFFTPPSGHVSGTISLLDAREGVHRAPAGVALEGVCDLSHQVDDAAQLQLDAVGVNCVRAFRGRGVRLWGARTLSDDPAARPLSVRRLMQTVARWLELRLSDFVFETNDALTWNRLSRAVEVYLDKLYASGGLRGKVPAEAFYVKCDAETNPAEVRDAGMLVAEIGVAPLLPQEFITLRLVQRGGGTSVIDTGES